MVLTIMLMMMEMLTVINMNMFVDDIVSTWTIRPPFVVLFFSSCGELSSKVGNVKVFLHFRHLMIFLFVIFLRVEELQMWLKDVEFLLSWAIFLHHISYDFGRG